VLYSRYRDDPSPNPPLTCANPASNHEGDGTRLAAPVLRTIPQGDYRTELDLPSPDFGFVPMARLAFGLKKNTATDGYVKARCFDANHVWNLRTRFTYRDDTTQTVNSRKTCRVG
jgi:hypothetical protein